LSLRVP